MDNARISSIICEINILDFMIRNSTFADNLTDHGDLITELRRIDPKSGGKDAHRYLPVRRSQSAVHLLDEGLI
jgi:hypothetical protein